MDQGAEMISDLGSHRLPPALMQAVSPEAAQEITRRNRAGRKGMRGTESHNAHSRKQRAIKRGELPPTEYTMSPEEALMAAGIPL